MPLLPRKKHIMILTPKSTNFTSSLSADGIGKSGKKNEEILIYSAHVAGRKALP